MGHRNLESGTARRRLRRALVSALALAPAAVGIQAALRVEEMDVSPGASIEVDASPLATAPEAEPSPPRATPATPTRDESSRVAPEIRWFDGRPIRPARTIRMRVTAYSPDERSCENFADGRTASGYSVWTNGMRLAAADTKVLPFGTLLSVPGYDGGEVLPVLDRGGRIRGKRLDVLYPTHEQALEWGIRWLDVTVWEYADGKPNGFRQRH